MGAVADHRDHGRETGYARRVDLQCPEMRSGNQVADQCTISEGKQPFERVPSRQRRVWLPRERKCTCLGCRRCDGNLWFVGLQGQAASGSDVRWSALLYARGLRAASSLSTGIFCEPGDSDPGPRALWVVLLQDVSDNIELFQVDETMQLCCAHVSECITWRV